MEPKVGDRVQSPFTRRTFTVVELRDGIAWLAREPDGELVCLAPNFLTQFNMLHDTVEVV